MPSRKVHVVMRELKKLYKNKEAKKLLSSLESDVEIQLPREDCHDNDGNEFHPRVIDTIWGKKYNKTFAHKINAAYGHLENQQERETPLSLLDAAFKKLNHSDMDLGSISVGDLDKAMKMSAKIKTRANDLESEAYHRHKKFKGLETKN